MLLYNDLNQAFQIDIYIYLHTLAQIRPPLLHNYSPHAKALSNYSYFIPSLKLLKLYIALISKLFRSENVCGMHQVILDLKVSLLGVG